MSQPLCPFSRQVGRGAKFQLQKARTNVYSLINRGFVPQGSDLSRLLAPSEANPSSIIKQSKAKLNKPCPQTWDPVKRYSTFDRPAPIPYLVKPQKKLPPLPEIATNPNLQKHVAKTLEIKSHTNSMRMLEQLAHVERPENLVRYKPPCPIVRQERIRPSELRVSQTHPRLRAPPGTRQTSASYDPADSVRTDPSNNWTIFIKGGFVVSTSDAYLNFQNRYNEIWPQIRYFIWKAENVLQRYAIPCAEIKCSVLISMAQVIPAPAGQLSLQELRQMLFNADEVLAIIKKPGQIYKGSGLDSVPNLAARCIQNKWRAYKARIELKDYHDMMISSMTMIKSFRLKKFRTELYRQILGRFEIQHKRRFYNAMNALMLEWKETNMATRSKVILQMAPRFSNVDIMDFVIGRVMMLFDGFVEKLVLVIPFLTKEKETYIRDQLACGFLDLDPLKSGRLILISPETARCFVPGSSVAAMLQSSHKALRHVKAVLDGKLAIFMTDGIGRAEISLSSHLDIPLFGPKPEKAKRINTRHKARVFLRNAGFEVVPGMSFKAGHDSRIKETLILLSAKYPNTAIWELFEKRRSSHLDFAKPDCAFDAWIDIDKVPKPSALDEKSIDDTLEFFNLTHSLKLARCPNHVEFVNRVCGVIGPKLPSNQTKGTGGFIQACPVRDGTRMRRIEVGFLLDYSGKISQLITAEVVLARDFEQIGVVVPQQRLPHAIILKLVERLQLACAKGGIVGYVTLQLTVWRDIEAEKNGWWANNLYPFLSPNLLKASSVLVSTGCEIDSKSGISSFQWTDIPLHLERTQNAVYTNHPMLRKDFENTIMKQAGGATEQRVAIYADNLRNEEIVRMTWRGTVGSDYKATIQAFLKDLTTCHRRLKHYDVPDLVSNIKDTARFFIQDWKNIETHPELYLSAPHLPEISTDAYKSIFNIPNDTISEELPKLTPRVPLRSKARAPSTSGAETLHPGNNGSQQNLTKHSRQVSFLTTSLKDPPAKKHLHEDLISSDSDDSFTDDHVDRQGSVIVAPAAPVRLPEFRTIGENGILRPLTTDEKTELFNLKKLRSTRLADKPQPPAWWDTFTFVPSDPITGVVHHVDPYDPKTKTNKHFELDPSCNPKAHEDLDILVANSIPALAKLAASSRPVTSCHRKIQEVLEEIERSKRPPPPPRAQRSSLTITLLNEGVPSILAGKYDPTFKKPHITPPVKQTERYLKLKRGEYSSTDMTVVEAALGKYERIYEEKFPTEALVVEVKKKKKPPGARVMFGKESDMEETEEEMLRSQTDVAVAAAFALMREVNARDIDAPATPRRNMSPRTGASIKDLTEFVAEQQKERGKSPLSQVPAVQVVEHSEDEEEKSVEKKKSVATELKVPSTPNSKIADRISSPATEDLKRQLIEEKSSSVMAHLNNIVNHDDKSDRLKTMLGSLLMDTRNHETETPSSDSGSLSTARLSSRGTNRSNGGLNRSSKNLKGDSLGSSKSGSPASNKY
ncbi:UNVERIFIED_CONTAM: hypothetical protein HDU68_008909 [Siphonaria sp. JEL0065]|nr:hypothetical protein HDU68_008909 [Siphonaria sp. JEL0065]